MIRVLDEVGRLDSREVLAVMKSQSSATPFGFLGSFFALKDRPPQEMDVVVEDEGNGASRMNKEVTS